MLSCSPRYRAQGEPERFGQLEPKILIKADGYFYGREHVSLAKVTEMERGLPCLEKILVVTYVVAQPDLRALHRVSLLADIMADFDATAIDFVQLPFSTLLFIVFSSGTGCFSGLQSPAQ